MRAVANRLCVQLRVRPCVRRAMAALCLAVLTGAGHGAAHAQGPGPCAQDEATPLDAALAQLQQCQNQAAWLAWVGDRLNRAGRVSEAAEHLERALLLEPTLLPAQLGYLLALAASGDTDAALALAQDLLGAGSLPPDVAQPLQQRVAAWQRELQARQAALRGWATRLSAGVRLGYDSNPLGAPNLDSLTLILAGQPVQLPLDPSYRSQGSAYLRMDAGADATRGLGDMAAGLRLDLGAQVRRRVSAAVPASNLTQGQVGAELSRAPLQQGALPPLGWYANASAALLESASASRFASAGLGGGLQWRLAQPWAACDARTGAEMQQRNLTSNPVLSGRYAGLLAVLQCVPTGPGAAVGRPLAWQVQLAHGSDQARDPARPGGTQRQTLLRATATRGPWLADVEIERRQDARAYSALLGGDTRYVTRQAVRLEWQGLVRTGPGVAPLQLRWGAEWGAQRSNIGLFAARSWGPYVALRLP